MDRENRKLAKAEYERMIAAGAEPLTWDQLLQKLSAIGYSAHVCFKYFNKANPHHYPAAHIAIIDRKTGLSFANVGADSTNLQALQEIRRSAICLVKGRIAEL